MTMILSWLIKMATISLMVPNWCRGKSVSAAESTESSEHTSRPQVVYSFMSLANDYSSPTLLGGTFVNIFFYGDMQSGTAVLSISRYDNNGKNDDQYIKASTTSTPCSLFMNSARCALPNLLLALNGSSTNIFNLNKPIAVEPCRKALLKSSNSAEFVCYDISLNGRAVSPSGYDFSTNLIYNPTPTFTNATVVGRRRVTLAGRGFDNLGCLSAFGDYREYRRDSDDTRITVTYGSSKCAVICDLTNSTHLTCTWPDNIPPSDCVKVDIGNFHVEVPIVNPDVNASAKAIKKETSKVMTYLPLIIVLPVTFVCIVVTTVVIFILRRRFYRKQQQAAQTQLSARGTMPPQSISNGIVMTPNSRSRHDHFEQLPPPQIPKVTRAQKNDYRVII